MQEWTLKGPELVMSTYHETGKVGHMELRMRVYTGVDNEAKEGKKEAESNEGKAYDGKVRGESEN